MSALSHVVGGDLLLDATGSLAVVTGPDETTQRLIRRLCTPQGGYIWQPDFGCGLPQMVGTPMDETYARGLILQQLALDSGVDHTQPVSVVFTSPNVGTYVCTIGYVAAITGEAISVEVPLTA